MKNFYLKRLFMQNYLINLTYALDFAIEMYKRI